MTRNSKVLRAFVEFCEANPDLRFWQALRAWSGFYRIFVTNSVEEPNEFENTFYWEGKNK